MLHLMMGNVSRKMSQQSHHGRSVADEDPDFEQHHSQDYVEKCDVLRNVLDINENIIHPFCGNALALDSSAQDDLTAELIAEGANCPTIPPLDNEIIPVFESHVEDDLPGIVNPDASDSSDVADLDNVRGVEVMTRVENSRYVEQISHIGGKLHFGSDPTRDAVRPTVRVCRHLPRSHFLDLFYTIIAITVLITGSLHKYCYPHSGPSSIVVSVYAVITLLCYLTKMGFRNRSPEDTCSMVVRAQCFIGRAYLVITCVVAVIQILRGDPSGFVSSNSPEYCSFVMYRCTIYVFSIAALIYGIGIIHGMTVFCCYS